MSKPQKPPSVGSSLTDAVVAALGKIDEDKTAKTSVDEPVGAEAGCAATKQGAAPPPMVDVKSEVKVEATLVVRTNGFRNGPGSFSDLLQRWSGGPRLSASPSEVPPPVEPPKVEPALVEPALVEAPKGEPAPASEPPPAVEAAVVKAVGEPSSEPPPEPAPAPAPAPRESKPASARSTGPVGVRWFGRTDVGLVREHNEDNFLVAEIASTERNPDAPRGTTIDERGCVFAVCDGMGGAAAGEVASQMAVDTILEVMAHEPAAVDRDDFARRLVRSIEEAGHRIFSAAKMDRTRRGMGTTTTLAGLVDDMLFVGQVGDSRAYVLRGNDLVLITKDQSLVNQLIEAGQLTEEEAEAFEHSNIILQALGTTEEVTVDLTFLELRVGDRLMMCSDGLSGLVHSEMIREVLQEEKDLVAAAAKLIQMANAGGGHDNITVIVADFDGEGLKPAGGIKPSYQQYPLPPADDTVRGKSLPPRDMRMKSQATKPGADVKQGDYVTASPEGASESSGGSKVALIAVLLLVLLVLAAGAWYFFGGGAQMLAGAGEDAGETEAPPPPPPPSSDVVIPDSMPIEDPVEPVEAVEGAAPGTIEVDTDLDEGTLYVNGEARGVITDGMTVEVPPGAYVLEVRRGDTTLAGPVTVPVQAAARVPVELTAEVVEPPVEEPPVEEPPVEPPPPRVTPPTGTDDGTAGRRRGTAPPEARRGATGANGLPSNPF